MSEIISKDAPLATTIELFTKELSELGLDLCFTQELNPGKNLYSSVLIDKNNPEVIHTNGKGTSKEAARASALGEMAERFLNQSLFDEFHLGDEIANAPIARFKNEIWCKYPKALYNSDGSFNMTRYLELVDYYTSNEHLPLEVVNSKKEFIEQGYNEEDFCSLEDLALPNELFNKELKKDLGITFTLPFTDVCTSNPQRGICAIPLVNEITKEQVYFPIRFLESCYCTNGMCAGNSPTEAKVQGLSEIFERFVRKFLYGQITTKESATLSKIESKALPIIPLEFIQENFPSIYETILDFKKHNFTVKCYDASLGGIFPVVLVMASPINSIQYKISLGAHPNMKIALERTLTELMQGVEWNNIDLQNYNSDYFEALTPSEFIDETNDEYNEEYNFEDEDSEEFGNDEDDTEYEDTYKDPTLDYENFVKNFIDDSGEISQSFFVDEPSFEFVNWSFTDPTTEAQYTHMLNIISKIDKKLWCHDVSYKHMHAYRLIVPNFSEVYRFSFDEYYSEFRDISLVNVLKDPMAYSELDPFSLYEIPEKLLQIEALSLSQKLGLINSKESPYYGVTPNDIATVFSYCNQVQNGDIPLDWLFIKLKNTSSEFVKTLICSDLLKQYENEREIDPKSELTLQLKRILSIFFTEEFMEKTRAFVYSANPMKILPALGNNFENYPKQKSLINTYKKLLGKV